MEDMKVAVSPLEERAAQLRYERGLPVVTATTTTAIRRVESKPAAMRRGRMESWYRMYEIMT